jgi:hypothetical protein
MYFYTSVRVSECGQLLVHPQLHSVISCRFFLNEQSTSPFSLQLAILVCIMPWVLFGNVYVLHPFVSFIIMVMPFRDVRLKSDLTVDHMYITYLLTYLLLGCTAHIGPWPPVTYILHIRLLHFDLTQSYIFCSCNSGSIGRSSTYSAAAMSVPIGR